DAILTERPDQYLAQPAEIFVPRQSYVASALGDGDDEVLSAVDQPLLPVAGMIGHARTETSAGQDVQAHAARSVHYLEKLQHDAATWWTVIDTWRRAYPVILVDTSAATGLQRIIEDERLGEQQ